MRYKVALFCVNPEEIFYMPIFYNFNQTNTNQYLTETEKWILEGIGYIR